MVTFSFQNSQSIPPVENEKNVEEPAAKEKPPGEPIAKEKPAGGPTPIVSINFTSY